MFVCRNIKCPARRIRLPGPPALPPREAPAMQAVISRTEGVARAEVDSAVEVSVVMPCLNEARTVGRCIDKALRALGEMGIPGEVIVADNGSADGSPEIAE